MCSAHVQHEFGVSVDELDQCQQQTAGVQVCGLVFELKACSHLLFECLALHRQRTTVSFTLPHTSPGQEPTAQPTRAAFSHWLHVVRGCVCVCVIPASCVREHVHWPPALLWSVSLQTLSAAPQSSSKQHQSWATSPDETTGIKHTQIH